MPPPPSGSRLPVHIASIRTMAVRVSALLLLPFLFAFAQTILFGQIISVSDGDTVTLLTPDKKQVKVRLYGIDAPESKQAYGTKAKDHLSDLVFGKSVRVVVEAVDRYGRTVGKIYVDPDTVAVNTRMVRDGFAWWYRGYSRGDSALAQAEAQARKYRRGLWAEPDPVAPWEWRSRENKQSVPGAATASRKVNESVVLNTKSGVYHCPSCKSVESCRNCVAVTRAEVLKRAARACGICEGQCR